ncbi:MAG: hypothetical protein HDT38_03060 [Clostridiales bacterium]|nr:hypothetical protein [Clostridiales bacterium]
MERWRAVLKKLLFPGWGWVALVAVLGGIFLALTFLVFGDTSLFAYVSYMLSAYALTIFVAAVAPPLFSSARRLAHSVPLAHRYLTDRYFKVRFGLILSLFVNLCYAGFKLACAVRYSSFWVGALALYYVLLCVVRLYLLRRVPKDGQEQDLNRELQCYRATGLFLFGLDLALSGVVTQIVRDGYGSNYPGMLIYVAAAHAFYSLTLAIVNTVKYRKFHSPVLSAAKAVNLTTALVSMFNLETAMIDQFGDQAEQFRLIMTACTAFAVCVTVLAMAAFMVISATRKLRRLTP